MARVIGVKTIKVKDTAKAETAAKAAIDAAKADSTKEAKDNGGK